MKSKNDSGFTLLEMLIAMTVAAILIALAVPSFLGMMDRNAVVATSNDLLASLLLARSEAIKGERVAELSGSNGFKSWSVQVDTDNDKSVDTTVLQEERSGAVQITAKGGAGTITYNPRGRANVVPNKDYFEISKNGTTRYLCFSPTGRPYLKANGGCP